MKKILSAFIITAFIAQAVISAAPASAALNEDGTGSANAVSLGTGAQATGTSAIAIGHYAKASGNSGTAIGLGAGASGYCSSAIGGDAQATAMFSVAIGTTAWTSENATNSVVLGNGSYVDEADTVSVGSGGKNPLGGGTPETRAISNVTARDIAVGGTYAATTGQLYAINKSVADTLGIAYDDLTAADETEKKYFTIGGDTTKKYTVQGALDELYANASSASDPNAVTYDGNDGASEQKITLRKGSDDKGTQIKNVADGSEATDAANVGQVDGKVSAAKTELQGNIDTLGGKVTANETAIARSRVRRFFIPAQTD